MKNTVSQKFVGVFSTPLPRNGRPLLSRILVRFTQQRISLPRIRLRGNVFIKPLPNIGSIRHNNNNKIIFTCMCVTIDVV
jgi:hypothetical protein